MVPNDVRDGSAELTPAAARRERPQRLALALALSLVAHAIVAGLWPARQPAAPRSRVVAETISIETSSPRPTPAPSPPPTHPPTPTPAPRTPPPRPTFAPRVVVRAPAAAAIAPRRRHAGGRARPKIAAERAPAPRAVAAAAAVATSDASGLANGGTGDGAGPGAGTGGLGETGAGASGAGDGGETNAAPCGSVDFDPVRTETRPDGSQDVTVRMEVTLRAGTTERDTLGWPWHYASASANPFDAKNGDRSISMQLPPAGFDLTGLKPAVAYAIRHTSPEGILAFEPCP